MSKHQQFQNSVSKAKLFESRFQEHYPSWKRHPHHSRQDFERSFGPSDPLEKLELKTDHKSIDSYNLFIELNYVDGLRPSGLAKAVNDGIDYFVFQIGLEIHDEVVVFHYYVFNARELLAWVNSNKHRFHEKTVQIDYWVQGYAIPIHEIVHLSLNESVLK